MTTLNHTHDRTEAESNTRESMRLRVTGMSCAGCAATVQRALEGREGVSSASVSVTDGVANVEGRDLNASAMIQAIRDRGFDAEQIEATTSASEQRSDIEKKQAATERIWRYRAIVGLGLWVPLESLHWIGAAMHWHGPWMPWLMFIGSTIIIVFAGSGFYKSAWKAATKRTTNMDTLIALGATTAYIYSAIIFFGGLDLTMYFAEAAGLLGIVSLGHWFEARASAKAGSAVRELLKLQPETAEVQRDDGTTEEVSSADVQKGARIVIRPGGRVPVDGVVVEGGSAVDESIVTGESVPVEKTEGDQVSAGSMNTTGRLVLETTVDGRNTTVARIADLVQKAQTSRAPIQRLADRISSIFVPTVLSIAAVTLVGWWLAGDLPTGVISAVTVLIISCPCALGLATPMAVMVGTGAASKRGILIKRAESLERIGRAQRVIFDKTGTLTEGSPNVTELSPASGINEDELLRLAASVEAPSEHPIARAIVEAAEERGLELSDVDDFQAIPGSGVKGRVDGREVVVERDEEVTARVTVDGRRIGTLTLTDEPRPDAKRAVEELRGFNLEVVMLSGDKQKTARQIGGQLGIRPDDVIAGVSPDEKADYVRGLEGESIMVGDGLNDAAALAAAGTGVAMASGTNIAIESAAVVIPGDQVRAVPNLIRLSNATLKTIRQNLFFAFVYNASAIPLAAFGMLGEYGPLWAAMAMGLSDITVIGNALRLKRRLEKERQAGLSEER